MKHRRIKHRLACMAMIGLGAIVASGADMLLVDKGISKVPIIVAADAPPATVEAVKELAAYIQKISGAKPEIVTNTPDPLPESAIWVGAHPKLAEIFPGANLNFTYPEEILQLCNGRNLFITGRDCRVGDKQTEYGTANSIYTFIEKKLDVRWLWPGPLGEDIVKQETLAFAPFEYRFHPVFLKRLFWPGGPRDWHLHQRLALYSYPLQCGHGFTDWWEKYGETHPEYFALQANGTRTPVREGSTVKLCISNPGVWTQWLDNAEQALKDDPSIRVLSATPNDGPWHCTCENCRAWDNPDAPDGSLTDRHLKFWNILARGLKERFPDREIYVGAAAYAAYYAPPVAGQLEPNVALAQVGHFPLTDKANRKEAKEDWHRWAAQATRMWYRPNLWYWAGGVWGLPEVSMKKTVEDFRFLADNKCIGIEIDVLRNIWSTQGPTYYLMAQLAYDPYQDGETVMKDYYRRAFGPAAAEMEVYWTLLEDTCEAFMDDPAFKRGSGARYALPDIFVRIYSPEWMARVEAVLQQAEAKVADSGLYQRRVAFVRTGFDFTRLLVQTIPLMTRVRESQAKDGEAVRQVQANWEAIAALGEKAEPYALAVKNIRDSFIGGTGYQGRMQDYLGPPTAAMLGQQKPGIDRYVAQNGQTPDPLGKFTGWDHAASDIQAAVDAAENGDTVWVAPGVYGLPPTSFVKGNIAHVVNIDKWITVRSFSGTPADTIINAGGAVNTRCVRMNVPSVYNTLPAVRLSGFTLTNGNANGGGVLIDIGALSRFAIVENCIVTGNRGVDSAGGIYASLLYGGASAVSVIVSNTIVRNNIGGGMYKSFGSDLTIVDSRFENNTPYGLDCQNGTNLINRCVFAGNAKTNALYGAGITFWNAGGYNEVRTSLFYDNRLVNTEEKVYGIGGAAIATGNGAELNLYNCTIVSNFVSGVGILAGGLYSHGGSPHRIWNSIICDNYRGASQVNFAANQGHSFTFTNSCTTPITGFLTEAQNIDVDPKFVDSASHNFRLTKASPCLNIGVNQPWMLGANDLDGNPRLDPLHKRVDLGCYEYGVERSR